MRGRRGGLAKLMWVSVSEVWLGEGKEECYSSPWLPGTGFKGPRRQTSKRERWSVFV